MVAPRRQDSWLEILVHVTILSRRADSFNIQGSDDSFNLRKWGAGKKHSCRQMDISSRHGTNHRLAGPRTPKFAWFGRLCNRNKSSNDMAFDSRSMIADWTEFKQLDQGLFIHQELAIIITRNNCWPVTKYKSIKIYLFFNSSYFFSKVLETFNVMISLLVVILCRHPIIVEFFNLFC